MCKVVGKVASGLGKGRFYMTREGYKRQFRELLGIDPHPGTLNLELEGFFQSALAKMVKIEGFEEDGKTFGACNCYPARVRDIPAAIVRPEHSCYTLHIVEIRSPLNLRDALKLRDGDELEVVLQ